MTFGDWENVATNPSHVPQVHNYQKRDETVPDESAKISMNTNTELPRFWQRDDIAWLSTPAQRLAWNLKAILARNNMYHPQCPTPSITSRHERISNARPGPSTLRDQRRHASVRTRCEAVAFFKSGACRTTYAPIYDNCCGWGRRKCWSSQYTGPFWDSRWNHVQKAVKI